MLVVVLIHGGGVEADVASDVVEVVAGSGEGDLGSQSMASESSHRDLVFVHETGNVVWVRVDVLAMSSQPKELQWSELPKLRGYRM